ncbi:MAG: rod shape-determining protein RodA [Lachnospiraceae bacterium]|nr:rod shape-determining protein RodA [Lachnospiraceae bacterium]
MNERKQKLELKYFDIKLVVLIIGISIVGILAVGSAKESLQMRQIYGVIFGFFAMLMISAFDYGMILKLYWLIYAGNIGLLLMVQLFGQSTNNAQRWIEIAGIRFQPSETAKILLILFFAQFIMKRRERMNSFQNLLIMMLLFAPVLLLIYKQPDLSTSIMIMLIFCTVLYVGGLSHKIILTTLAIVIPVAVILLFLILQPGQTLVKDYQQERILAWLQPEKYALSTAYQQQNSITAIGSGQLWGKGLNNNEVGSVKNGNYISEPQTDFIFAIIGEEMGFVGTSITIILEMFIAAECFFIGTKARDDAGRIICFGMGALVGFQSFINIGVTTGLLPNTGLPLPFVSYGLTSLISLYAGMGFVLSVGLRRPRPRASGTISFTELIQEDMNIEGF